MKKEKFMVGTDVSACYASKKYQKNNMIFTFKKEYGITLIALVVTIVIMLILVGVAIFFVAGNDGVLKKTERAADETNKQIATEKINFKITEKQIDSYAQNQRMSTLQELADFLCEDDEIQYVALESQDIGALQKIEIGESKSIFTKLTEYPYEFEIGSDLRLASINGVKLVDSSSGSTISEEQINVLIEAKVNEKLADYVTKTDLNNTKTELKDDMSNNYAKKDSLASMTRRILYDGETVLSVSNTWTDRYVDISLPDISTYTYIEFQYDAFGVSSQGYYGEKTFLLAVDQIKYNNSNTGNWGDASIILLDNSLDTLVAGYFKNKTTFRIYQTYTEDADTSKVRIRKICGIK